MGAVSEYLQDIVFKEKSYWVGWFMGIAKTDKMICCYGAAAKGNVFLNYLGIKNDVISFCVDETPAKQGMVLPGSNIPVVGMDELKLWKPEIIFILPWNFKDEIIKKLEFAKEWNAEIVSRL